MSTLDRPAGDLRTERAMDEAVGGLTEGAPSPSDKPPSPAGVEGGPPLPSPGRVVEAAPGVDPTCRFQAPPRGPTHTCVTREGRPVRGEQQCWFEARAQVLELGRLQELEAAARMPANWWAGRQPCPSCGSAEWTMPFDADDEAEPWRCTTCHVFFDVVAEVRAGAPA